jgi:hypothetical protein
VAKVGGRSLIFDILFAGLSRSEEDHMIDHKSVAVRDRDAGAAFHGRLLEPRGLQRFAERDRTAGFGRRYPA